MKALEPHVLQNALGIQDELLGPTVNFDPRRPADEPKLENFTGDLTPDLRDGFHAINGLSNLSWFFHSPLQYWSFSSQSISDDKDIITTVNEGSRYTTLVNVTLRHSIVFSGKRFENHRLVAADALVITLVHMLDSPVGRQWEKKAEEIGQRNSGRWRLYPQDGRSLASTLYEFRFQPLSFQDDLFLGIAYSLTALYFALSLTKLRALKSRLGLILAAVTQIAVSIMSSFTICAIFKVDLSKIPREAYPMVILTVGLENIFRYINAVITTPSESPTAARMSEALGQTGHVALAGVAQNLTILWLLSKIVSLQIVAFCTFAAIALTFDFFYMLTFFTAVLSVDVRRTELSDSLTGASTSRSRGHSPPQPKQTWKDALMRGESPLSTRVAGTIVMVAFILAAQWHFFDNESFFHTTIRFLRLLKSEPQPPRFPSTALLSVDINQARTPTAWLRMQDHETAHEVIQVIKPKANSYIAEVYDPLIFVLDGSDRTPNQFGVRPFLPAAYDFLRHQSTPFFFTVVLCVTAVSLLMNYLLWDEATEVDGEERPDDEPLLSIKTLSQGHSLDVVLLSTSSDGVIASVGLDRWIRVWDIRKGIYSYIVHDPESDIDPFPVLAITIDNDSNWLALLSARNRVFLWNIPERRWGPISEVDVNGRTPIGFFFGYDKVELINPILVIRANGIMTELHVESDTSERKDVLICKSHLASVCKHFEKPIGNAEPPSRRIITSSKRGCIHVASQLESGWLSKGIDILEPVDDKDILSILSLPTLSSFLAIREYTVDLIDINTHKVTHTFVTQPMKRDSLRCFHSTRRRPQCGSVGLASFALAYESSETGNLVLQSYVPQHEGDTICFRNPYKPGSKTCCLWRETVENRYIVENPDKWEALPVGYIVGIRKKQTKLQPKDMSNHLQPLGSSGIRRRGVPVKRPSALESRNSEISDEDSWEVWSISARGEEANIPLCDATEQDHLLVGQLGPIEKVGKRSIAVGLGNVVKVITVGNEKFDDQESADDDAAFVGMAKSRRRRYGPGSRKRSS